MENDGITKDGVCVWLWVEVVVGGIGNPVAVDRIPVRLVPELELGDVSDVFDIQSEVEDSVDWSAKVRGGAWVWKINSYPLSPNRDSPLEGQEEKGIKVKRQAHNDADSVVG